MQRRRKRNSNGKRIDTSMNSINLSKAVSSIDEAIINNLAVRNLLSKDVLSEEDSNTQRTSKCVTEFFDPDLGNKKEIVMKKALAAAMLLAKQKNVITNVPQKASEIAAVIDDGLTSLKVDYLVDKGLILAEKAIEYQIDRAASRLMATIDNIFSTGMVSHTATEAIVKGSYLIPKIGPVIGPAVESCRPYIHSVLKYSEPHVQSVLKNGVKKLSDVSKDIIKNAIKKAPKKFDKIKKRIETILTTS